MGFAGDIVSLNSEGLWSSKGINLLALSTWGLWSEGVATDIGDGLSRGTVVIGAFGVVVGGWGAAMQVMPLDKPASAMSSEAPTAPKNTNRVAQSVGLLLSTTKNPKVES